MNIFKWTTHAADTHKFSPKDIPTETSCEGYVQKRGRFVKSWKHRYLVFDGSKLKLSYYESKAACRESGAAKGELEISSIQKENFSGSLLSMAPQPYGFKIIGHAKGKGYVEFFGCVQNAKDQAHWIQVVKNALQEKSRPNKEVPSTKVQMEALIGHDNVHQTREASVVAEPQQEIMEHETNTKELIHHALQEVIQAQHIGNDVCNELSQQNEMLKQVEEDLDEASIELNHGETLLTKMKNPMLHRLSHNRAAGEHHGLFPHHADQATTITPAEHAAPKVHAPLDDMDELSMLSSALSDLQAQEEEVGAAIDLSMGTIDRIGEKTATTDDRLKSQSGKANHIIATGNLF